MVEVGVLVVLLVYLFGMGGEGIGCYCWVVDYGDYCVDCVGVVDFWLLESLYQWFGQGQVVGFDEDLVKVVVVCYQFVYYWEEFFLYGVVQVIVGQFENVVLCFFFVVVDGILFEDFVVDVEFVEFVDDYCDVLVFGVVQYVLE